MSSGIPLGQMLDMLESDKGDYARTVPTASGEVYPTGGTGNLPVGGRDARRMGVSPSLRVPRRSDLEPSFGLRSGPTPEEQGRVTEGTRALLIAATPLSAFALSAHVGGYISLSYRSTNQSMVSGMMRGLMGRLTTDPFDEAMQGFTKKAKKLSKSI